MKRYLIKISFPLLLMSFPLGALDEYPEWFLFQGPFPGQTVGYAYGGSPHQQDAEFRYAIDKACTAIGTKYRFQDYDEKHSAYASDCGEKTLKKIMEKLNPAECFLSVAIKRHFMGAFSKDPNLNLERKFININDLPRPLWLDGQVFFKKDDTYIRVWKWIPVAAMKLMPGSPPKIRQFSIS